MRENKKYKNNPFLYLDIDLITFLNFTKYSFLIKETYICTKKVMKDHLFDFETKINSKAYKYTGRLSKTNKRNLLINIGESKELSSFEKNNIIGFCKK